MRLRKLADLELYGPIDVRMTIRSRPRSSYRGRIVPFRPGQE